MEIKQSLFDAWHNCCFIIRSICFHHGIHVHLPTGRNLQTIPGPHHGIQVDRSCCDFMLVVFFGFSFSSMDSIEIWLFCVPSLVSQHLLWNSHDLQKWPYRHGQWNFWFKFLFSVLVQSQRDHFIYVQVQRDKRRIWVLFWNKCLHPEFLFVYHWRWMGI